MTSGSLATAAVVTLRRLQKGHLRKEGRGSPRGRSRTTMKPTTRRGASPATSWRRTGSGTRAPRAGTACTSVRWFASASQPWGFCLPNWSWLVGFCSWTARTGRGISLGSFLYPSFVIKTDVQGWVRLQLHLKNSLEVFHKMTDDLHSY